MKYTGAGVEEKDLGPAAHRNVKQVAGAVGTVGMESAVA